MTEEQAKDIVNAIFHELDGRGGFDVLGQIMGEDPGIYKEMHAACVEEVKKAHAGDVRKWARQWMP